MLDKMVNMKYSLPDNIEISGEGRDLLQRMLLPDPNQRIQLEQIMVHPWFVTNLPPEAATMNDSYLRAAFPAGECEWGCAQWPPGQQGRAGRWDEPASCWRAHCLPALCHVHGSAITACGAETLSSGQRAHGRLGGGMHAAAA
jgi:hypothetical protein